MFLKTDQFTVILSRYGNVEKSTVDTDVDDDSIEMIGVSSSGRIFSASFAMAESDPALLGSASPLTYEKDKTRGLMQRSTSSGFVAKCIHSPPRQKPLRSTHNIPVTPWL